LVSFEGIDASGKNTQSKLLCDYFKENKVAFEFLSFPEYSTPIGTEIKNYLSLKRNYGAEAMHMLYAANRYEFKPTIDEWVTQDKFVVLNRYCESNIAYGIAHGLPRLWLEGLENRMPQADYVVFLKIDPELSQKRKASRDRFETNLKFLGQVSEVYDALASAPRWITVDGDRDSSIVHYEVLKTLSARLEGRKIFNPNLAPNNLKAGGSSH
jgi:dTMP kinase